MIDRRKNPREFFISGWDPYVVELTAESRGTDRRVVTEEKGPENRRAPPSRATTRWRTMLLARLRRR